MSKQRGWVGAELPRPARPLIGLSHFERDCRRTPCQTESSASQGLSEDPNRVLGDPAEYRSHRWCKSRRQVRWTNTQCIAFDPSNANTAILPRSGSSLNSFRVFLICPTLAGCGPDLRHATHMSTIRSPSSGWESLQFIRLFIFSELFHASLSTKLQKPQGRPGSGVQLQLNVTMTCSSVHSSQR
jgi:hypothetical protein